MSLSNEVEQALDSLLSMFQEDQWIEQVINKFLFLYQDTRSLNINIYLYLLNSLKKAKLICDDVEFSCGSITQFKVAMLENLPISNRGRLLRRFFAFRFLFGFAQISQQIDIVSFFFFLSKVLIKYLFCILIQSSM